MGRRRCILSYTNVYGAEAVLPRGVPLEVATFDPRISGGGPQRQQVPVEAALPERAA